MQDYRNLKVWQKSHAFAIEVHLVCESMPRRRGAALASQLRRSALSISANIVEGASKGSDAEFRRFLLIAMGSAAESDYHLLVARDTMLLPAKSYDDLASKAVEIRRMLAGLIKRVTATIESKGAPRLGCTLPCPPRRRSVHVPGCRKRRRACDQSTAETASTKSCWSVMSRQRIERAP